MIAPGLPPDGLTTSKSTISAVPFASASYCSAVQEVLTAKRLHSKAGGAGKTFLIPKLLDGPLVL